MDEKLVEGEIKPKITRSRARHIRRKRLISARRAAENGNSIVQSIETEQSIDSKNPDDSRVTDSLSKSKARRLRKRNKTQNDESSEKILIDKPETLDSPLQEDKSFRDEIIVSSSKSTSNNEFSNGTTVTANEHELLENEKNRKLNESTKSSSDSSRRIKEDHESGIITIDSVKNFITGRSSRIIIERETREEPKVASVTIEESSSLPDQKKTCDKKKSVNALDENVSELDLKIENPGDCTMSDQVTGKMNSQEKSRDQIKADREAKKAAKAAAKNKVKVAKPEIVKNVSSTASVTETSQQKSRESRGDVVDGEIIAKFNKVTISPVCKGKTEVDKVVLRLEPKIEEKSKSELRAERRAKQEAQRAAKQSQISEKQKPKSGEIVQEIGKPVPEKLEETKKIANRGKIVKPHVVNPHEVNLFKHLYHEREQALINVPIVNSNIHPAIVRLGVQYADKVIVGSNARCVALLAAVKQLIHDFERSSQADFTRGLETSLQESSAYLHHCRPLAVSMQNALRHLKWQMTQLEATTPDEDAKSRLGNAIDTYIQEQIQLADKAISITIQTKISNGDVILTYGYSSLIYKILCDAHDAGRQFRVVVVDGRPWLEGREQLRRLAKHGLECSYVLINALSFIMPSVSKVFLGAHAILANGAVMSRVGTAQVSLMAKSFNIPVLVACETHKTCERVQTDSIVYNEIANPDELAHSPMGSMRKTTLSNWRGKKSLNLLNITYDVTPADLVTAVVTELAILPCTSVPVILRIKPSEI
ncbi:translation initiation factor eIF-2B subunit delta [Venturia canescens]|uniref:translation initiation factor eIF-2B subunit delta n=1 Tax=Venturia canescens TaxID=32260 RepID=UPI001C9BF503|nr:translation initiation factor eIF-2B subunit delta [Venturia canescens]XP_043284895.1 translation initiation factor eIF-2B subunit delta [Venturia canescens]XP_043284896.1 translation initiation factor eIF-2B subunit delta [Venturia canescens]